MTSRRESSPFSSLRRKFYTCQGSLLYVVVLLYSCFLQGLESLDHVLFLDHLRHMHLIVTCAVIEILSWMEIIDKCRLLVKLISFHCV